jgi:hypothetical protein
LQTKFSDKLWEQIIKTIDINGDNQVFKLILKILLQIEFDEFREMMLKFKDE